MSYLYRFNHRLTRRFPRSRLWEDYKRVQEAGTVVVLLTAPATEVTPGPVGLLIGPQPAIVDIAGAITETPSVIPLIISQQFSATVSAASLVTLEPSGLLIGAQSATITGTATVSTSPVSMLIGAETPAISGAVAEDADAIGLLLGPQSPSLSVSSVCSLTPLQLAITTISPEVSIEGASSVAHDPIELIIGVGASPTVTTSVNCPAGPVQMVLAVQPPANVGVVAVVTLDAVETIISTIAHSVVTSSSVSLTPTQMALGIVRPILDTSGSAEINALPISAAFNLQTVTDTQGIGITTTPVTSTFGTQSISVSTGVDYSAGSVSLVFGTASATFRIGKEVSLSPVPMAIQPQSPESLGVFSTIFPSPITSSFFVTEPSLQAVQIDAFEASPLVMIIGPVTPDVRELPHKHPIRQPQIRPSQVKRPIKTFAWMGLRQADRTTRCVCVMADSGANPSCRRCLGTGFGFTDYLVPAYMWMATEGVEYYMEGGRISTQTRNIVVQHDRPVRKFDQIVELSLDPDTGQPHQPFVMLRTFLVQDTIGMKGTGGRLEFWKCEIEERTLTSGQAGESGPNYIHSTNR